MVDNQKYNCGLLHISLSNLLIISNLLYRLRCTCLHRLFGLNSHNRLNYRLLDYDNCHRLNVLSMAFV